MFASVSPHIAKGARSGQPRSESGNRPLAHAETGHVRRRSFPRAGCGPELSSYVCRTFRSRAGWPISDRYHFVNSLPCRLRRSVLSRKWRRTSSWRRQSCLQRDDSRANREFERIRSLHQQQPMEHRHFRRARRSEFGLNHEQLGRLGEHASGLGNGSYLRNSLRCCRWQPESSQREPWRLSRRE